MKEKGVGNGIYVSRDGREGPSLLFYWLFLEEYVLGYSVYFILCL